MRKGIYQSTHESLEKDRLRKALKEMPPEERELVERQKRFLIAQIRGRGGRFGEASANEVLSKLGVFLIAKEQELKLDLSHRSVMRKLIENS